MRKEPNLYAGTKPSPKGGAAWTSTPSSSHCTYSWTIGGVRPWSRPAPPGSSGPDHRPGSHHPGDPRAVAALPQREGLLALCFLSPARVLPEPLLPGPVQPQGTSPCARVARSAAVPRRGALRSCGRLPRDGHDPPAGHSEGEGIAQGALLRAGHLREERLQDRVGLRLQGGPG